MQSVPFFGIDASKDELVIAKEGETAVRRIPNSRSAIGAWLRTLPGQSRLGIEPSGRYHLLLADLAVRRGFAVYVLDPRRVHHYARALGYRGKTDRIDALVIARYLASEIERLRAYQPPTPAQRRIDAMLRRRAKLVVMRAQLNQMSRALPGAHAAMVALREKLSALIATLERQAGRLAQTDPAQAALRQRLERIPSFGSLAGTALSNLFCRVPFRHADQAVAFVGLDPRPHDSGQHRGRRKLTKHGPSELRRLLYLAAMSASRTALWKPYYLHDTTRGLSTTEALNVLARRLLRVAWAVATSGRDFDPARVRGAGPKS